MQCSVCLILGILDQGQVTKYFFGISLVIYPFFTTTCTQIQGLNARLELILCVVTGQQQQQQQQQQKKKKKKKKKTATL